MTRRKHKRPSPASAGTPGDVLQAVGDALMTGNIPDYPVAAFPEEDQRKLGGILSDIVALRQFASALAQGDLSQDLSVRGEVAGCLRALQLHLRHRTRMDEPVAGGTPSRESLDRGEALRKSELRLRDLFDSMDTGIAVFRPVDDGEDYFFIDFNRGAERIEGKKKEQIIGRNITEIFPDVRELGILDLFQRVRRTGKPERFPYSRYRDERIASRRENYVNLLPSGDLAMFYEDLTEQMQAEEALQRSEGQLHTLVHTLPDLIWLKDPDGVYLACNHMFERFFGAKESDIVGKTDYAFLPPDQVDFFRGRDRIALEAKGPVTNEEWITFADDGHCAMLETIKTPMYDAGGNLLGVLGIGRDITERTKVGNELRQSEERFRTLCETSLIGIYIFQNDRICYVNPAFAKIFKYTPDEMVGMTPVSLVYPDDRALVVNRMRGRLNHINEIHVDECRMVTRDNTVITVTLMGALIHYRGRPAVFGNLIDITERKSAETALKESEEKYRSLFDESPISLWEEDFSAIREWMDTKTDEGIRDFRVYFETHPESVTTCVQKVKIIRINRATMTLFGTYSLQEFSRGITTVFSPESFDAFRDEIVSLSLGKTEFECEVPLQTISGEQKIVLLKMIVVAGYEKTLGRIVISLLDITDRKNMEDALRQANRKISMLSSITCHDIQNQLTVLRGYIDLSLRRIADPAVRGFIMKGDRAAETIGNHIAFMKNYEDIGVKAPEWQDIPRLIQAVRSQLSVPDTVEIVVDLPHVLVFADGLIEKVFYNLIENTLRHGEHVTRIRISFCETDSGAEILYEDNGAGISQEDKQNLFQRGFGKHTGLGLFLSREILAITGLTMRETGEPGKGVRFEILIPDRGFRLTGE